MVVTTFRIRHWKASFTGSHKFRGHFFIPLCNVYENYPQRSVRRVNISVIRGGRAEWPAKTDCNGLMAAIHSSPSTNSGKNRRKRSGFHRTTVPEKYSSLWNGPKITHTMSVHAQRRARRWITDRIKLWQIFSTGVHSRLTSLQRDIARARNKKFIDRWRKRGKSDVRPQHSRHTRNFAC